jgi:hypothetical protein
MLILGSVTVWGSAKTADQLRARLGADVYLGRPLAVASIVVRAGVRERRPTA